VSVPSSGLAQEIESPPLESKGGGGEDPSLAGEGPVGANTDDWREAWHSVYFVAVAFDTFNAIKMKTSGRNLIFWSSLVPNYFVALLVSYWFIG
jgi:hypothetical protein